MRWTIQLCWHCTTTTVLSRAAPSVRLFLCPRFPPLWSRVLNCGGFAAPGGTEQDWKALRVNPAEVVLTIISSQQTQGKARALLDSWGHQLSRCCFFLVVSIFLDLHPHTDTPTHTHTHTHSLTTTLSTHEKGSCSRPGQRDFGNWASRQPVSMSGDLTTPVQDFGRSLAGICSLLGASFASFLFSPSSSSS